MPHLIEAAGWPSILLVVASVVGLAVIFERLWALRYSRVLPRGLLSEVLTQVREQGISPQLVEQLDAGSPLGRIFSAGLRNERNSREAMKEAIEEAGRAVLLDLERSLSTLGTIASISPLLGLFGTVVGMILLFGSQSPGGSSPEALAQGISVALYNTAFGLVVAVPSMIFYRLFRARIDRMIVEMEQQAVKLVEVLHGDRQP
ncbi:MAG: MotA/TolQ/ExbB proton channel family protein [Betaproteobacteria bacterium]|nr:MotA/TolQ/ExbB proton channel family protein [Betaproteobacteria bacterium]MDE2131254.1 MotA/TolQ/ExbB proton channel family protein [Betaproteobacteria bacterium]MDE2211983.1 MotA/TolQ/ExbB proton channel family protein [Betaproteobacteria bacterium]